MSAALFLAAAKTGVDMLGAYNKYSTQKTQSEIAQTQAEMTGELERFQLRRQGEVAARQRQRRFAEYIGSQRASTAAAGVTGGRTARMAEAESETEFMREQALADERQGLAEFQSRQRQRGKVSQAKFNIKRARTQMTFDMFEALLGDKNSGAQGMMAASKASAAAGG